MVRVYYNPEKKVFVAKDGKGNLIKVDRDFGVVDTAAHAVSPKVEYDVSSFPKEIRLKVVGKNGVVKPQFKSVFMKLVFSYKKLIPPDSETRKVAREIVRHSLEHVDTVNHNNCVYIITRSKTYDYVVFRIRKNKYGWSTRTVPVSKLPEPVRQKITGGIKNAD